MRLVKYLLSELRHSKAFSLFFVANLSIGLAGFIALDGFKTSIEANMRARSKSVLGADLSLSARRPILPEEEKTALKLLPSSTAVVSQVELYSMVSHSDQPSRLVRIKAVGATYPYYGGLKFSGAAAVTGDFSQLHAVPVVYVYHELLSQMNLSVGDILKIGTSEFKIVKSIIEDTTAGMGATFAPTVYISTQYLQSTGLVTKGSLAWHSRLFRLPSLSESELDKYKRDLFAQLPNPDIRVETHFEASEQMARLLHRLNDYLGLAAVVALFLASVGAGFLYRSYFQKKIKEVAILSTLGLSKTEGALYYLFQIVILGFLSALVALLASFILVPIIQRLTEMFLPFQFEYSLSHQTVAVSLTLAILGSVFVCIPFLSQIRTVRPAILLTDFRTPASLNSKSLGLLSLPGLALFVWLSIWQANSWKVGSIFVAAFVAAGLCLFLVSYFSLLALDRWSPRFRSLSLTWALRDLARDKATSISCFLALGLGAVLLNLVPQVEASLAHELQAPESSQLPSLFMFDVQEEQLEIVKQVFRAEELQIMQISPMVRARLISINDTLFDKGPGAEKGLSREEQDEMRFRNRGFNLSYRDGLLKSEAIVAGAPIVGPFAEGSSEVPAISVEKRFAERLSLKLGDILEFEIEGVSVRGKIVNFRSVKWTSFQPNFFVQFQPGVLESAPKSYILTAAALADQAKASLQNKLVGQVPNISIIDVSQLVKKIAELIQQMSLALQAMAVLCLVSGFVVIFSIVSHQVERRRWQIGLYKVLGAPFAVIQMHLHLQYFLLALLAGGLGVIVSAFFSFLLSTLLFENVWVFDWLTPTVSIFGVLITTGMVVHVASFRYLREEPKNLLS